MTAALTSAGVQSYSIAIASGSLTGTASISAVGAGAFMNWQGQTSNDSGLQLDDGYGYLTRSGTTITATRGVTGTSKTMVINGGITDGDTTNLVKTVQEGTISVTNIQSSSTASLSAVTNANTATYFLGLSVGGTQTTFSNILFILSLATTTMTAARQTAIGSSTAVVAYGALEHQGAALNSSVQNVAYSATNTTTTSSNVALGTSVTTGNSMVFPAGISTGAGNGNESTSLTYSQLTSGTNVAITWGAVASAARKSNATVVEYVSGILAQSVQRGTIALSAATSNTATITSSPTAQTLVNWLYNSSTATTLNPSTSLADITQTDAVTLTVALNSAGTITASYEAVNFSPASSGTTSSGAATEDADTAAGAGVASGGSAAVTEDVDVAAGAGVASGGSAAVTEDVDIAAGAGVASGGSAAVTETNDTASAAALLTFIGSVAVVEADDIAAGAGAVAGSGTNCSGAAIEDDDTAAGVGAALGGSAAVTEDSDTAAGAGAVPVVATQHQLAASGRHHWQNQGKNKVIEFDWYKDQEQKRAEFRAFVSRQVNPEKPRQEDQIKPLAVSALLKEGYNAQADYNIELLLLLAA